MKLADFHIHSTYSDGQLTIPEIVGFYGRRGFRAIAKEIRHQGGLVVAAHPVSTKRIEPQTYHLWDYREEYSPYFDAWEVASGAVLFEKVKNIGLPMLASSDFHTPHMIHAWKTTLNCELHPQAILDSVREQHIDFCFYNAKFRIPQWKLAYSYKTKKEEVFMWKAQSAQAMNKIKDFRGFDGFKDKLLNFKLKAFQPKISFTLDMDKYIVKTADQINELKEILRLRHEVFIKEFKGKTQFMGVDFDRFDLLGDHILVRRKEDNRVVGTYRLICNVFSDQFYSSEEFHLKQFLGKPGVKLELGRACIDESFRSGASLSLVWKGLAKYSSLIRADYLFGCSSIKTTCYKNSMYVFKKLSEGHFSEEYNISPTPKFLMPPKPKNKGLTEVVDPDTLIPSLLKTYLKAGAKIHSLPAFDRDFKCIDMLTILDMKKLNPKYKKRYFVFEDGYPC